MTSILNQYFHSDGCPFLMEQIIFSQRSFLSLNKDTYLVKRDFANVDNGIAFFSHKNKNFFDVVQPNKDKISSNLSAGTLSIEWSSYGEKIFTNCGASESLVKKPTNI